VALQHPVSQMGLSAIKLSASTVDGSLVSRFSADTRYQDFLTL